MTTGGRHAKARRAVRTPGGAHRNTRSRAGARTGSLRMARIELRTGLFGLLGWPLAMAGLVWAITAGVHSLYNDPIERARYGATVGSSPATAAFNGRGYDLDTLGGIAAYEVGFFGLLFLPTVAVHLAIRHTRAQEDAGRTDLVTAARIGRLAPLVGATVVVTTALGLSGLLTAVLLVVAGLPVGGSVLYAAALALFVLVFMAVGLASAEASQTGRGAYGLALSVIGGCYLVRAVIDGRGWAATWATPMSWLAEARPFGDSRIWPYVALAMCAVALGLVAVFLRARRDVGAGMIAPRPGPATGSVHGPFGLTWRITKGTLTGWAAGAVAWGFAVGLLSREMRELLEGNPTLNQALLGSAETPEDVMTYIATILIALMGAAVALQGVGRLAAEESTGRLGVILSTRLSRTRWWAAALFVLSAQVCLTLLSGGAGYGLGAAVTTGNVSELDSGIAACVAYLPAGLLFGGIAALLLAMTHRVVPATWILFVWCAVVALLADTLSLPQWARDLSPLEHLGQIPITDPDITVAVGMVALAAALAIVAVARLRQRDLAAG